MRGRGNKLRSWLFLPAILVALAAQGTGLAQDAGTGSPTPPTPPAPSSRPADAPAEAPMDELAQKHYDDGQAAAARGDWQAAYTSFRAGIAVQSHSQMVRALGDTAHHLGKFRDAAEYLALYLQKAPPTAPPAERAAAEKMLADAKTRVGTLAITAPAGAEIFVDKAFVGKAPLGREVFVEPGNCEVEARSGAEYGEQRIVAPMGASTSVTLVFGVVSPPPPPTASASAGPTASGAPLVPPAGPRTEIVIGGAALAGVSIVAGAVLLGLSAAKGADEEKARADLRATSQTNICLGTSPDPQCAAVKDAASAVDTFRSAGGWLVIGGVAVGAATGLYYLLTRAPAEGEGAGQALSGRPKQALSGRSRQSLSSGVRQSLSRVQPSAVVTPQGGGGTLTVRW